MLRTHHSSVSNLLARLIEALTRVLGCLLGYMEYCIWWRSACKNKMEAKSIGQS